MDAFLLFVSQHSLVCLLPALASPPVAAVSSTNMMRPSLPNSGTDRVPIRRPFGKLGVPPADGIHGRTSRRDYSRKVGELRPPVSLTASTRRFYREGWPVHALGPASLHQILDNPTEEGTSVMAVCADKRKAPFGQRALCQNRPAFMILSFPQWEVQAFPPEPSGLFAHRLSALLDRV
jgi:hypothetical protein